MRLALCVVAALALLSLPAGLDARAQDGGARAGGAKLPFNPFAKSAEGDWTVFEKRVTRGGTSETDTLASEVTKASGDTVTVTTRGLAPPLEVGGVKVQQRATDRTFSRTDSPSVSDYLGGLPVAKASVKDDKHVVSGKQFDCKAISFEVDDLEKPGAKAEVTIWISPEVTAGGLVAMRIKGANATVEGSVAGYGARGKTLWGKSVDEATAGIGK